MKKKMNKLIVFVILIAILFTGISSLFISYANPDGISFESINKNNKITRLSDNATVDSYKDIFNESNGTRYDGRIWSDKSVYSYDKTKGSVTLDDNLSYVNSGNGFQTNFATDFLNVFSVLGSSEEKTQQVSKNLVIVIDNSASMYANVPAADGKWEDTRIAKTIAVVNKSINNLMQENSKNEVSVVLFGDGETSQGILTGNNTAQTIIPMGHYDLKGQNILSAGWSNGTPESPKHGTRDNASGGYVYVNKSLLGEGETGYYSYSNGTTNIHAGMYVSLKELLTAPRRVDVVDGSRINRIPSVVVLTDGAATDMLNGVWSNPVRVHNDFTNDFGDKRTNFVNEWNNSDSNYTFTWNMFIEKKIIDGVETFRQIGYGDGMLTSGHTAKGELSDSANPNAEGREALIEFAKKVRSSQANMLLSTLMTTAYLKRAIEKEYRNDCKIYTISVDMPDPETIKLPSVIGNSDSYEITSNPMTVNPQKYFNKEWLKEKGYIKPDADLNNLTEEDTVYEPYTFGSEVILGICDAIDAWNEWKNNSSSFIARNKLKNYVSFSEIEGLYKEMKEESVTYEEKVYPAILPIGPNHSNAYFIKAEYNNITYPNLKDDVSNNPYNLTDAEIDIINCINSSYYASTSLGATATIESIFDEVMKEIAQTAFVPVKGSGSANDKATLTYVDQIGDYLEVKDIMKMLLFGKEYSIVYEREEKKENTITNKYYKVVGKDGLDETIKNATYEEDEISFKLSEIILKVEKNEDTGIQKLYINLPSATLPIRLNSLKIREDGSIDEYKSNNNTVNSLPLRILYTVGMRNDLADTNSKFDLNRLSLGYIENNTKIINGKEYISFYSNYFSNSRKIVNETMGNANLTFLASDDNLFYIFQDNLIIYKNSTGGEGELAETGGKVTLSDAIKNLNEIEDDRTYYFSIKYYLPKEENKGESKKVAIAIKGSDLLNSNGQRIVTYYNTKNYSEETEPGEDIVVATKVGTKCLFNIMEFANSKVENVTQTATLVNASTYGANVENDNVVMDYLGNNGELQIEYKGYLKIEKEVTGERGDFDKDWNFEVRLTPKEGVVLDNSYQVKGESFIEGVEAPKDTEIVFTEQEDGTYLGNLILKHGQSITIEDIPGSTSYQVIEKEANTGLYETIPTNDTGVVKRGAVAIFKNNKYLPPQKTLELRKEVLGNGDLNKNWEFEIRLIPDKESRVMESYSYTGGSFVEGVERLEDSEIKFTKQDDGSYLGKISLKHGQSVIIQGIEEGISYEVKEIEANHNDYMTTSSNEKGIIDDHKLVKFENTKEEVILPEEKTIEIRKEVLRDGDKNKDWEFKIILTPKVNSSIKDTYSYTGNSFIEGVSKKEDGTINFTEQSDGTSIGTIKLKHGETITIQGIEVGTNYKIEEVEANQNDYKTIEKNQEGKLSKDELILFENTLTLPDKKSLEIRKEVRGISGDKNKEWEFKIKLTPVNGRKINSSYTYTGVSFINGVEKPKDGTITFIKQSDGSLIGTIKLKHGEGIIINDLEVGTTYQVIETEANLNHYKLDSLNDTGIISQNTLAYFQNTNGFTLPKTGELGTILPALFGTIFIGFGVGMFLYINNKKEKLN